MPSEKITENYGQRIKEKRETIQYSTVRSLKSNAGRDKRERVESFQSEVAERIICV